MTTKDNAAMPKRLEAKGHPKSREQSPGLEHVNGYELQAIETLFAWLAEEQNAAPETVRGVTEASFGTHDVGAIPRKSYDEVVRFLLDLRLDDILN